MARQATRRTLEWHRKRRASEESPARRIKHTQRAASRFLRYDCGRPRHRQRARDGATGRLEAPHQAKQGRLRAARRPSRGPHASKQNACSNGGRFGTAADSFARCCVATHRGPRRRRPSTRRVRRGSRLRAATRGGPGRAQGGTTAAPQNATGSRRRGRSSRHRSRAVEQRAQRRRTRGVAPPAGGSRARSRV